MWTIWFCVNLSYYGAFIWIPSLLVADGFSLVKSFSFTLIITLAQLPGYAVAAWLIELWGRRVTLAVFLLGSAAAAGLYGAAATEALIILAGCLLSGLVIYCIRRSIWHCGCRRLQSARAERNSACSVGSPSPRGRPLWSH